MHLSMMLTGNIGTIFKPSASSKPNNKALMFCTACPVGTHQRLSGAQYHRYVRSLSVNLKINIYTITALYPFYSGQTSFPAHDKFFFAIIFYHRLPLLIRSEGCHLLFTSAAYWLRGYRGSSNKVKLTTISLPAA